MPKTVSSPSTEAQNPITKEDLGSASAAAVRQYLRAAQDYQIDTEQALNACGLPVGILNNTVSRIKGSEFQQLISFLIEQSQDPLFGLKSAQYVHPGSYSIIGYMVMNCHSAREALHMTPTYESIVGDMGITKLEKTGPHLAMRWICQYTDENIIAQMVDNVLASWTYFARWLTDMPDGKPLWVELQRSQPAKEHLEAYQDIFCCPIKFNCKRDALIFDEKLVDTPLRQPDPELLANLTQQANNLMKELDQQETITLQVRNILSQLMKQELPRKEKVAAALDMNERTLQRRLQEAGTSYQRLLDDLRRETAIQWLTKTDMNLSQIADKLGFSEARSFHRRFKSWTGLPPGEYRTTYRK